MNNNTLIYRYRTRFARKFPANQMSHLQHMNAIRNIIISAGLNYVPLKLKKTDVPKISVGPALSLGYESNCEYADIYLTNFILPKDLHRKLSEKIPDGFAVLAIERIPYNFPSVEALVNAVSYEIKTSFEISIKEIEKFLSRDKIEVKKVKPSGEEIITDAKPFIIKMERKNSNTISLMVKFGSNKNIKPDLIIDALTNREGFSVLRKDFYWKNANGKLSVL